MTEAANVVVANVLSMCKKIKNQLIEIASNELVLALIANEHQVRLTSRT